jgi:autotransporter-associated beta strand protein
MIKEYAGGASSYGGNDTRVALQWKLTGLGIRTYEIVWDAAGSSMSFVQALLDTSADYATVVPSSGNWTAGGNGNWSDTARWAQNATNLNFVPQANGNATFKNTATAAIDLDGNRTVGSIIFDTAADTSITSASNTLTVNTGITTTAQATGSYLIDAAYSLNSLNVLEIEAGRVIMNKPIASTGNYGLVKQGEGILELRANNTFNGGLNVSGGTLRVAGNNTYTGSTTVGFGNLVVAANAGSTGALGSTATAIFVGLDSTIHSGELPAGVVIEGNHTISRPITFSGGTFQKTLGAIAAPTGATFSGLVNFGTSTNVRFNAATATDKLNFTGGMSNGNAAGTVLIDGAGVVTYGGGVGKVYSYADATNIDSGTLKIDPTTTFNGNGNMTVGEDAQLLVHGTLNGTGSLSIDGGTLGGSGTINRVFTLDNGDVLLPGNNPGTLSTIDETWGSGATLKLEMNDVNAGEGIGWDYVSINGSLSLTATTSSKFKLELHSLTALNAPGAVGNFNPASNYTWKFLAVTGAINGFDQGAFEIDSSAFLGSAGVFSVHLGGDNKSLTLQYLAVPEPSSTMLALCGAVFFFNRRRRATARR